MASKLALLIDAENISYRDLPRILEEVPRHGELVLRAVYGDWEQPNLQKWREIAEGHNFKIRHQTNASKTKNSSDMKLIMDAMEVLYRTPVDIFCLVSNDADYVPLCDKIHESKKYVIGVGNQQAAEAFIRACDVFIFIGRGEAPAQPSIESLMASPVQIPVSPPEQPVIPAPTDLPALRKLLSKAFTTAPQDTDRWATISSLVTAMIQAQPGFPKNSYGHAPLTKLLQTIPDFVELRENGSGTEARLKISIPSKQPTQKDPRKLLSKAFAVASPQDTNKWILLAALGDALRQVQPGFDSSTYGHTTLTKLLQAVPDFVELRANGNVTSARLKTNGTTKPTDQPLIRKLLSEAFSKAPQDANRWVELTAIGQALSKLQPGFQTNHYGYATLTKLLQNMPDFVELQINGSDTKARLEQ